MAEKDKDFLDEWTDAEAPSPEIEEAKPEAQKEADTAPEKVSEPKADAQAIEVADPELKPDLPKFPPKEGKRPFTEEEVTALIEMRRKAGLIEMRRKADLIEMRRKADDAERKAAEMESRLQFFEQQQKREAEKQPSPPDILDEPEKYREWQSQQQYQALLNERMNTSEIIARQSVGDEKVDAAIKAIQGSNDPMARQRITNARHPYGELLKWHDEVKTLSEIQEAGGLDKLIERRLAERAAAAPVASVPGQPKPTPPPSLAKAGQGRVEPSSERQGEDEFFSSFFRS